MIFGGKSGKIGSFGKAASSNAFNPVAPAAAKAAAPVATASASSVDWTDFTDALARHVGLSGTQAKAARASGRIKAEGRLWTLERTGYFDNKLMLRAQVDIDLTPLPAPHLIGVFGAAAVSARLFGCAMWLDDADSTLQVSWHVGDVTRLSEQNVIAAYDEAKQVVESIETALITGLATDPAAVPASAVA
jgi:hypothetical protein